MKYGQLVIEQDGCEFKWYHYKGKTPTRYFTTNSDGDGIFIVDLKENSREQLVGTCDFYLSGLKDPKAKIRRWVKR